MKSKNKKNILYIVIFILCILFFSINIIFIRNFFSIDFYIYFYIIYICLITIIYYSKIIIVNQFKFIFRIINIFILAILFYNNNNKLEINELLTIYLVFLLLWIFTEFKCIKNKITVNKKNNLQIIINIKKHKHILILLFLTFLFRLIQIGTFPRNDSGLYYFLLVQAVEKFRFGTINMFNVFRLAQHTSIGYAMLLSIGEFIMPRMSIGPQIVNLIITEYAIFALYKIFNKLFINTKNIQILFVCFFISVIPTFLGLFSYFSLDYGIILFFILLVYAQLYNKYILMCVYSFILMNSKENGIILFAGYVLFQVVYIIKTSLANKKKKIILNNIIAKLKLRGVLYLLLCGVIRGIWLLLFIKNLWGYSSLINNESDISILDKKFNCFAIRPEYIISKIRQGVIMNFNWIIIILLFILALYIYFNKDKYIKSRKKSYYTWGIMGAFVANICFSLFYVTARLPRYNVVYDIILALILVMILLSLNIRTEIKNIFISILSSLLIVQTYITIDPIMLASYPQINTGKNPIVFCKESEIYSENQGKSMVILLNDYIIYNYQYSYIDKAYDKILNKVNYNSEMDIVQLSEQGGVAINRSCIIDGEFLTWNVDKGKRTFQKEGLPLNAYSFDKYKENIESNKMKDKILVICTFPEDEQDISDSLENYFLKEKGEAEIGIKGCITYQLYFRKSK